MIDVGWKMLDGEWKMADVKWMMERNPENPIMLVINPEMENGRCQMDNGWKEILKIQ